MPLHVTTDISAVKFEAWRDDLQQDIGLPAGHRAIEPLERWLKAAYQWAERLTQRSLLNKTVVAVFDKRDLTDEQGKALTRVFLPGGPARTINTVKTFDEDDDSTTVSSANYRLEGKPSAASYAEWPYLAAVGTGWSVERERHAMEVNMDVGYGASHTDLPLDLRLAVERRTYDLFRTRSDVIVGTITSPSPMTAQDLIQGFIIRH